MSDKEPIEFTGLSRINKDPIRMLESAKKGYGKEGKILVVGWDSDGYFCSQTNLACAGDILWLMEVARKRLLSDA